MTLQYVCGQLTEFVIRSHKSILNEIRMFIQTFSLDFSFASEFHLPKESFLLKQVYGRSLEYHNQSNMVYPKTQRGRGIVSVLADRLVKRERELFFMPPT